MKSLKLKLLISITGMLLLLSAVNLTIGLITSYRSIIINVETDLTAAAQIADNAISSQLDVLRERSKSMAAIISRLSPANAVDVKLGSIGQNMQENGYISGAIADREGVLNSTDPVYQGKSVSDNIYFKRAAKGETVISTPYKNDKGELIVTSWSPIGESGDILMTVLDGYIYSSMIEDIRIGKTGNVFIIDRNGVMIANMRPQLVEEQQNFIEMANTDKSYQSAAEVYSRMAKGETDVSRYLYAGVDRICAFAPVASSADGWSFAAVAPLNEMTSSINITFTAMITSSVIMLLMGIAVASVMASKIAHPIVNLNHRMRLLSEGDLTTPVPAANSKDEVGILVDSTGKTITALQTYIAEIADILDNVADGNLDISTSIQYKGEFTRIETSLSNIIRTLNSDFYAIAQAAQQVSSGAEQVQAGAQSLSQSVTEQASSAEELAATINDISVHISQNAEHSVDASQKVGAVGHEIMQSNQKMTDMNKAMSDITSSSQQISKIIKTIEDIAFQTNILALNAAVEAARAGSAGKGFAVVAHEVRNLASKSSQASKDTTELIMTSLQAVERGTRIAEDTTASLISLADNAHKVVGTIDHISSASKDQASSIKQVTLGIDQISSVIQTNSATAEESAAASEELAGLASTLKRLVGKWRLKKIV